MSRTQRRIHTKRYYSTTQLLLLPRSKAIECQLQKEESRLCLGPRAFLSYTCKQKYCGSSFFLSFLLLQTGEKERDAKEKKRKITQETRACTFALCFRKKESSRIVCSHDDNNSGKGGRRRSREGRESRRAVFPRQSARRRSVVGLSLFVLPARGERPAHL